EDRVVRITGHVQHLDPRPDSQELLREFRPAHLWHHDIRQQQMDGSSVFCAGEESLDTMARLHDRIAMEPQRLVHESADCWLIFNQENCFAATPRIGRIDRPCQPYNRMFDPWKVDSERRAPTRSTFHSDAPPALLDDTINGREPQSRPFPFLLCREEWFEKM